MVRDLNEKDFETAVAEKKGSLIDFWAPWCGPCRMTGPQVEAAAEELDGKASFFKVNVDDNPGLARQFGVMSIPTLIVLQDGEEAARMVGARNREDIKAAVEEWR